MFERHKKIVSDYFRDATIWFYGMLGFFIFFVAMIAVLLVAEPLEDMADLVKPLIVIGVIFYALWSGRGLLKFKKDCMKDLKNGSIETKSITVARFGGDGKHNLGALKGSKKPMGKIKYVLKDTEGMLYYIAQGNKKALPDDAIVGRTITVTYLANARLVLEIALDIRDDIDASLDNFRETFPQYFERIYN